MQLDQQETTPGVYDALSQFVVNGSLVAPRAAADGATSGNSRDHIQDWLRDILTDANTASGIAVNSRNALCYPPCFYAIQKVSGHLGMMSWSLKQKIGDRKHREATDHAAYRLLKFPNQLYTGSVFTEVVTGHMIYRGNGRAYIERDQFMRPKSLTVMLPDNWDTLLVDGQKWHAGEWVNPNGTIERWKIPDRDVLHIMGFSKDGITGVDVLQLARDSIGLGLAAERQQAKHFARNAIPGLLLTAPKGTFPKGSEDPKKFLKDFRDVHEGSENAGKTALLQHGITATQLSQTGRDSQTIESRQFQREEVALWWMLESMIGQDGQSYNSEEQRQLAYLKGLPGKAKKRWEEERDNKLLAEREKDTGSHYHQLNAGSLLQADMRSTLITLKTGIDARIYSPNDARDILGMDSYEGGDKYENPNTSSNKPEPSTSKPGAMRARLVASYKSRLADLFAVEASRVRAAFLRSDDDKFAIWRQQFYSEAEWPKTLCRVWQELGGSESVASELLARHAKQLDDFVKADQSIETLLKQWACEPADLAPQLVGTEE